MTESAVLDPIVRSTLESGIQLADGFVARPSVIEILECGDQVRYRVVLAEGKYHEVRRMFAAMGTTVIGLQRVRFGSIKLTDFSLLPGHWTRMEGEFLEQLYLDNNVKVDRDYLEIVRDLETADR